MPEGNNSAVELTAEEIEQQEMQDFEESFSGEDDQPGAVNVTDGDDTDEEKTGQQQEKPQTQQPAAKTEPPDRITELEKKFETQIRNLNGNLGGLKNTLLQTEKKLTDIARSATAKSGHDTPSNTQISEALKSGEKMAALKRDFPEFGAAVDELMHGVEERIKGIPKTDPEEIKKAMLEEVTSARESMMSEIRGVVAVDMAHPGWEDTVKTAEFKAWLTSQPDDVKALAASDRSSDAINMLNKFKESNKSASDAAEKSRIEQERKQRANQRLASATSPSGVTTRTPGKSEEEDFEEGFNS